MSGLLSNLISNPRGIAATLGAPASLASLPVRVSELVKAQDLASERLIIRVQLVLALALSVLYVLAPRPTDAPMHLLAAVPVALMCYLAFVGIRFALSLRGPLPGWLRQDAHGGAGGVSVRLVEPLLHADGLHGPA